MLIAPSGDAEGSGGKDYTSQWPGSYFRAAFEGSRVFFRVGQSDEILHIVVDGQSVAPLIRPEQGAYEIDGLGDGSHAVSVLVATESQDAPNTFSGFAIPVGEKALTPEPRHRQIEFIGDSHTVGFGNISTTH
ncbi:MAG TPA: GDSL family lipase, partial [Alloacidobacterium sp.]|nr:GDSL family lipase [Alloacidobacterium sp.]